MAKELMRAGRNPLGRTVQNSVGVKTVGKPPGVDIEFFKDVANRRKFYFAILSPEDDV